MWIKRGKQQKKEIQAQAKRQIVQQPIGTRSENDSRSADINHFKSLSLPSFYITTPKCGKTTNHFLSIFSFIFWPFHLVYYSVLILLSFKLSYRSFIVIST